MLTHATTACSRICTSCFFPPALTTSHHLCLSSMQLRLHHLFSLRPAPTTSHSPAPQQHAAASAWPASAPPPVRPSRRKPPAERSSLTPACKANQGNPCRQGLQMMLAAHRHLPAKRQVSCHGSGDYQGLQLKRHHQNLHVAHKSMRTLCHNGCHRALQGQHQRSHTLYEGFLSSVCILRWHVRVEGARTTASLSDACHEAAAHDWHAQCSRWRPGTRAYLHKWKGLVLQASLSDVCHEAAAHD
eukprot:1157380-Pelagomonas_calceolata.AAC.3